MSIPTPTKEEQLQALQVKKGESLDRYSCHYQSIWTDEVGTLPVCQKHGEWSIWSFEYGPNRPCILATLEDKHYFTAERFLKERIWKTQTALLRLHNSELMTDEEYEMAMAPTKMMLEAIDFQENWPVLVERPIEIRSNAVFDNDTMAFTIAQQFEWLTRQEYAKRFGTEAPTSELMRKWVSHYEGHPDFNPDWSN